MGVTLACVVLALALPQQPSKARLPDSGLVLAGPAASGFRGFDLGDGGVDRERGELVATARGRCITPGGVEIHCRPEGARLRFPSGAQLLLAPDGFLHARGGAVTGPFEGGVQLWLGDDSVLTFELGGSRRAPIRAVIVSGGGRTVQLWRRREPLQMLASAPVWSGERLFCLGDGAAVYRSLALGPLVTLERRLGAGDQTGGLPAQRLALQVPELMASVSQLLEERDRDPDPEVAALRAFAAQSSSILDGARHPVRIDSDPLTFLLRGGYELRLAVDHSNLCMNLSRSGGMSFAEWRLGYGSNLRSVAATRPVGRAVAVPAVARELGAREERNELGAAMAVIAALRKSGG